MNQGARGQYAVYHVDVDAVLAAVSSIFVLLETGKLQNLISGADIWFPPNILIKTLRIGSVFSPKRWMMRQHKKAARFVSRKSAGHG